jgi:hypothetical protein
MFADYRPRAPLAMPAFFLHAVIFVRVFGERSADSFCRHKQQNRFSAKDIECEYPFEF